MSLREVVSKDTTITDTITSIGDSVQLGPLDGVGGFTVYTTGTWVGTLAFQGSYDGSDWYVISGRFQNADHVSGTTESTGSVTVNGITRGPCSGFRYVRVVSTAWTSGTATVNLLTTTNSPGTTIATGRGASSTYPFIVQEYDNTFNVASRSTSMASTNINGNGQSTAHNVLVGNHNSWTIGLSGTWTGTVVFEASIDGTNFFSIYGTQMGLSTGILTNTYASSGSTAVAFHGSGIGGAKYFRVRSTAWTSGTATVYMTTTENHIGIPAASLPAGSNTIGGVTVASALPAGSNIIGNFRIDQTTPGTTNGVEITGRGTLQDKPIYVHNNEADGSMVTFATNFVSNTPVAWNWKDFVNWNMPANGKLFVPKMFSWSSAGVGGTGRVTEKMILGTFSNGPATFTDGSAYSGNDDFCTELELLTIATWPNTTVTVTVTYVDQGGTGGRTVTISLPANTPTNSKLRITNHIGTAQFGIQDVTNISISPSAASGSFQIRGIKEIARSAPAAAGACEPCPISGGLSVNPGRILGIEYTAPNIKAVFMQGTVIGYYKPIV